MCVVVKPNPFGYDLVKGKLLLLLSYNRVQAW
jgi:hypothetical protein